MFKRILVPLDGSVLAEQTFPLVAHLARATEGSVILQHVISPPREAYRSLPEAALQSMIEINRVEGRTYLEKVASSEVFSHVPTQCQIAIGSAASSILSCAQAQHVDLIVLSRHGYSGSTRWNLGGVAEKVVHEAGIPILLLPNRETPSPDTASHDKHAYHVLVPLDGSPLAEAAILPAAHLATALSDPGQGTVRLTQVVRPTSRASQHDGQKETVFEVEHYLHTVTERLYRSLGPDLKIATIWSLLAGMDVAATLLEEVEATGSTDNEELSGSVEALAMTTHGWGGIQYHMIGSIAERVLRATTLPLLLIPSREPSPLAKKILIRHKTAHEIPFWADFFYC